MGTFVDCDAFIPNLRPLSQDDEEVEQELRAYVYRLAQAAIAAAEGRAP